MTSGACHDLETYNNKRILTQHNSHLVHDTGNMLEDFTFFQARSNTRLFCHVAPFFIFPLHLGWRSVLEFTPPFTFTHTTATR